MKKLFTLLTAALLATLLLTACAKSTGADLEAFASITLSGLDGEGTASVSLDYNAFEQATLPEDATLEQLGNALAFFSSLKYEVTPSNGLSNGDAVSVSITYSEEAAKAAGLKVTGTSFTHTVQGLAEPVAYDYFANIEVIFHGASPNLWVEVINNATDTIGQGIHVSASQREGLAIGDAVTLTASLSSSALYSVNTTGVYLLEESRTYTAEAADKYVEALSELPAAGLTAIHTEAQDLINADLAAIPAGNNPHILQYALFENGSVTGHYADYSMAEVTSPTLTSTTLLYAKPAELTGMSKRFNHLVLVYEVTVSNFEHTEEPQQSIYIPIVVTDLILTTNGTLAFEEASLDLHGPATSYEAVYAAYVESNMAAYLIETE